MAASVVSSHLDQINSILCDTALNCTIRLQRVLNMLTRVAVKLHIAFFATTGKALSAELIPVA